MLRKITKLIISAVVMLVVSVAVGGCGSLPEGAAASVNGVTISTDAVTHRIDLTRILYPSEVPDDKESQDFIDYRGNVTKQLVSEEIERQEAEKRDLSVSDQEIEDALTIYVEDKYLGNIEKMEQAFSDEGVSVDDLRAEIQRDLLHQKLLDSVRDEMSVTDEEVAQFYEDNKSRYVYPERRQVRQIVTADEASAQAAAARLSAGESITTVASDVSIDPDTAGKGGLVGLMTKDQLPPAIADIAFSLQTNQVSQPFQADSRWYLVEVDIISPASNQTLDDLKDSLNYFLRNQKFAERWREYSAGLWDSYDISYADGYKPPESTGADTTATAQP